MKGIADSVKNGEPGTLLYAGYEHNEGPDSPTLVLWEKYGSLSFLSSMLDNKPAFH